jgi:hypothetical protein
VNSHPESATLVVSGHNKQDCDSLAAHLIIHFFGGSAPDSFRTESARYQYQTGQTDIWTGEYLYEWTGDDD